MDESGTCYREVGLRALTGREEDWLANVSAKNIIQASVVTELLTACVDFTGPFENTRQRMRDLSPGDRDYLLLKLYQATFGAKIHLVYICPKAECRAKMDVMFDIDNIPFENRKLQASYLVTVGKKRIRYKLPSGGDLEALSQNANVENLENPINQLLRRCLLQINGKGVSKKNISELLTSKEIEVLKEEIERVSPKVDFEMTTMCPECGEYFTEHLAVTDFFLNEVLKSKNAFTHEIHLLGFHYHWPLHDLLEMTRPQRQTYLQHLLNEIDGTTQSAMGLA